jgi:predicted transcriptional regulator
LAGEEISPEVKHFIHSTINSVEQLEVLLFLMSNAERAWTADEISSRVRLTHESVTSKLEELLRAKLLTASTDEPPQYCYEPDSKALAQEVADSLDKAFRERKDTVIQLIFSRPMDNIKVFADAFRIRRDE